MSSQPFATPRPIAWRPFPVGPVIVWLIVGRWVSARLVITGLIGAGAGRRWGWGVYADVAVELASDVADHAGPAAELGAFGVPDAQQGERDL